MKKSAVSLFLVLLLVVSVLNVTAFAYSDHDYGVYRGKNYNATLYVCKDYVRGNCTYAGGGEMTAIMRVTWFYAYDTTSADTMAYYFTGSNGSINTPYSVQDTSIVIRKATESFNVKSGTFGTICSLSAASY